jgi:hypothetical protein
MWGRLFASKSTLKPKSKPASPKKKSPSPTRRLPSPKRTPIQRQHARVLLVSDPENENLASFVDDNGIPSSSDVVPYYMNNTETEFVLVGFHKLVVGERPHMWPTHRNTLESVIDNVDVAIVFADTVAQARHLLTQTQLDHAPALFKILVMSTKIRGLSEFSANAFVVFVDDFVDSEDANETILDTAMKKAIATRAIVVRYF